VRPDGAAGATQAQHPPVVLPRCVRHRGRRSGPGIGPNSDAWDPRKFCGLPVEPIALLLFAQSGSGVRERRPSRLRVNPPDRGRGGALFDGDPRLCGLALLTTASRTAAARKFRSRYPLAVAAVAAVAAAVMAAVAAVMTAVAAAVASVAVAAAVAAEGTRRRGTCGEQDESGCQRKEGRDPP
jgi:hypothetical protein